MMREIGRKNASELRIIYSPHLGWGGDPILYLQPITIKQGKAQNRRLLNVFAMWELQNTSHRLAFWEAIRGNAPENQW